MALAMIHPVPEKGGRGKKKTMDETSTLFSPKRLQLARTVLAHSPDLAQGTECWKLPIDPRQHGFCREADERPAPALS
jgi:hypothetical protein